ENQQHAAQRFVARTWNRGVQLFRGAAACVCWEAMTRMAATTALPASWRIPAVVHPRGPFIKPSRYPANAAGMYRLATNSPDACDAFARMMDLISPADRLAYPMPLIAAPNRKENTACRDIEPPSGMNVRPPDMAEMIREMKSSLR